MPEIQTIEGEIYPTPHPLRKFNEIAPLEYNNFSQHQPWLAVKQSRHEVSLNGSSSSIRPKEWVIKEASSPLDSEIFQRAQTSYVQEILDDIKNQIFCSVSSQVPNPVSLQQCQDLDQGICLNIAMGSLKLLENLIEEYFEQAAPIQLEAASFMQRACLKIRPENQHELIPYLNDIGTMLALSSFNASFEVVTLFESLIESAQILVDYNYIDRSIELIQASRTAQDFDTAAREIIRASQFPLARVIYLKESAAAQREVCAQELLRLLIPVSAIKENPQPKYRLATLSNPDQSLIPQPPKVYIASEKINFHTHFFSRSFEAEKQTQGKPTQSALFIAYSGERSQEVLSLNQVVGTTSVLSLCAFLGDTDTKVGNIGVRLPQEPFRAPMMVKIDSGYAFSVNPQSFLVGQRFDHLPLLSSPESYANFIGQSTDYSPSPNFKKFLTEMRNNAQGKLENRLTALHIALMTPDLYEIFVQQYLSFNKNIFHSSQVWPGIRSSACNYKHILQDHLISKRDKVLGDFLKNTDHSLFNYFVAKRTPARANIFLSFQNFMVQLSSFYFYQKKDFLSIAPHCLDGVTQTFLRLIQVKASCYYNELSALLTHWNPSEVFIEPRIERSSQRFKMIKFRSLQEARVLHTKISEILQSTQPEPLLLSNNVSPSDSHTQESGKKRKRQEKPSS